MTDEAFDRGVERLRANGFGLVAVFDCADMPDRIVSAIIRAGFDPMGYQRLVLLGNSGTRFWKAVQRTIGSVSLAEFDHPIDDFSRLNVEQVVRDHWGNAAIEFLYPGGAVVPLQQLGRLAGWHHDSPLGIGINRTDGLWFAYRAAFLIDLPLPPCKEPAAPSPCVSCQTHDCVEACPARAVHFSRPIDTDACGDYALAANSPCAATCRAREACPVAANGRYHREQITYHYRRAVAAIKSVRGFKQ